MTANPLALAPKAPKLSAQEWVDRGNAHLADIGRLQDVRWFLSDGRPAICWVR